MVNNKLTVESIIDLESNLSIEDIKTNVNWFNKLFNNPNKEYMRINNFYQLQEEINYLSDTINSFRHDKKVILYIYSNYTNADAIMSKMDRYISVLDNLASCLDKYGDRFE